MLLPLSTSTTLELVQATEMENDCQRHNHADAWKGPLSLEQYLRREALLADQDHTRNGSLVPWALTDSSLARLANGQRVVLSGAESFLKRALIKRAGSLEVEDVICHGVGSVFCPVEYRNRGYTSVLMRLLAKELKNTKRDNDDRRVAFSVLFSDIGRQFYARHGWTPFESTHVSLAVHSPSTPEEDPSRAFPPLPISKPALSRDLPKLCQADEGMLRKWFDKQQPTSKTIAAIIPDIQTIQWIHAREDFICREIMHRSPLTKGAQVSLGQSKDAWCYWTRVYDSKDPTRAEGNTLYIIRIVVEEGIDGTEQAVMAVAALLEAAQREAILWNMERVIIWNPSQQTLALVRG
ncbi:hypothetical protein BDV96DRAFT_613883 [Lophiotrema nucula]|uniref:LYC1 C-terminal domain-containing protein n=1 Tax=Lophiotrema nucula TaxID=690887 RepID=A0A6A5Z1B5_9PLEO|nr:hypothetical protein BDV96DRAFT_613883 [Lophiotrema nucula]